MELIKTNTAIGCVAGMPVLFTEFSVERTPLRNERKSDESPFVRFANARNLPELLIAVDALLGDFKFTDLFCDLIATGEKPQALEASRAEEICSFFTEGHATRTTIEKTREAIEAWSFDKAKPKHTVSFDGAEGEALNRFTPINDLVKAAEDLRRTSLLMAYLLGKTDFATAHGQQAGDRKAKMRTMADKEPQFIHSYYEKLGNNTGNILTRYALNNAVSQIHLYDEASIESTISGYVESAFTVLMSDERKTMSADLEICRTHNTVLSAAWSYFADGLNKEEGLGAIGVCKRCGKFFEQQRSTRVYCSDSCRVMALRNACDKEEPAERYETRIAQCRRQKKEAARN